VRPESSPRPSMLGSDVCRANWRRMASTWFQEARTESDRPFADRTPYIGPSSRLGWQASHELAAPTSCYSGCEISGDDFSLFLAATTYGLGSTLPVLLSACRAQIFDSQVHGCVGLGVAQNNGVVVIRGGQFIGAGAGGQGRAHGMAVGD
jgi:hypothetical protein